MSAAANCHTTQPQVASALQGAPRHLYLRAVLPAGRCPYLRPHICRARTSSAHRLAPSCVALQVV
jgi:hypothetical protein